MACINPNSPEFKAALERTGNPLLAEIEMDDMTSEASVKPGVEELFDSSPELANAVYEAARLDQLITPADKIVFGHPTIGKSYLKNQGENRFITLDDDFASDVNAFVDANRGSETRQEYKGRKPKEYNEFMLNLFDQLKVKAKNEGKILFVSNTNILKERMSDFDKVINIPKAEFKRRFDERGATYGFEDWKSDIDATVAKVPSNKVITTTGYLADLFITPQQKQQAQQLYSQYLDSIFPDSKVKDIVYRGDKSKTINGVTQFLKGERKELLFLSTNKEVAKNTLYHSDFSEFIYKKDKFGNLTMTAEYEPDESKGLVRGAKNFISAIVNIQNPLNKNAKNQSYRDYKIDGKNEYETIKDAKEKIKNQENDSLIVENVLEGDVSRLQSTNIGLSKPEQIHILGSKQDVEGFKQFVSKETITSNVQDVYNKIQTDLPKEVADSITVLENVPLDVLGRPDLFLSIKNILVDNGITDEVLINWVGINKNTIGHPKNITSVKQLNTIIESKLSDLQKENRYTEFKINPLALESFNKWKKALEKYPAVFQEPMLKHATKWLSNPNRKSKYVLQLSEIALTNAYGMVVNKPHELNRIGKLYDQEVLKTVSDAVEHEPSASGKGYWVYIPRVFKGTSIKYHTVINDLSNDPKARGRFSVDWISNVEDDRGTDFFNTREQAEEYILELTGNTANSAKQFKANVELLRKLSPSTWCTASSMTEHYVQNYDNYLLIVDGVTIAGIEAYPTTNESNIKQLKNDIDRINSRIEDMRRLTPVGYTTSISSYKEEKLKKEDELEKAKKIKVKEVTSRANNGVASIDHIDDIVAFFEKHNLDTDNRSLKLALDAKNAGKTDFDLFDEGDDLHEVYYDLHEEHYPAWDEGDDRDDPGLEYRRDEMRREDEQQHQNNINIARDITVENALREGNRYLFYYFNHFPQDVRNNEAVANKGVDYDGHNITHIDSNLPFYNDLLTEAVTNRPYVFNYLSDDVKDAHPELREIYNAQEIDTLPFSKTNDKLIQGYYDAKNDKVVVIASNTPIDEASKVGIHEVAHRGMLRMAKELGGVNELGEVLFGAEKQLMQKLPELLKRTGHKNLESLMIDYGFDKNSKEGKIKLLMELSARWAETFVNKPKPIWWKELLQNIASWIKQFTGKTLNIDEVNDLVGGFVKYGSKETIAPSEPMFQLEGTESSKASKETVALVKDFLKRIGVDIKKLENIVVDGIKQDANGAALIMQKLVLVTEGKENIALTEEAMHFAVEIIEQTNPTLFNQLLKEINSYNLLNTVINDYGKLKSYQTPDGKPDIRKLKKEAIAKVLAETIVQKNEGTTEKPELLAKTQTLWQKIIEALKGLFSTSGFDQAAMKVLKGEAIGTVEDIRLNNDVYLQTALNLQQKIVNKLREIASKIEKVSGEKGGYKINGKPIKYRVTQISKSWLEKRFEDQQLTKDEFDIAVDNLLAEKGTMLHAENDWMLKNHFLDADGKFIKEKSLRPSDDGYISQLSPMNKNFYYKLKESMEMRLKTFPPNTIFLAETTIYDPKRDLAGTVDFIAVETTGKTHILDWKFKRINNVELQDDIPWYNVISWRTQMKNYKSILTNAYGATFDGTEQTRMVPFRAVYTKTDKKRNIKPQLIDIEIGDVDPKKEERMYLVPVGLEEERTGEKRVDELIVKLNQIYDSISDIKVSPEKKKEKSEQLNELYKAIRQLKMRKNLKPLIYQAGVLNKSIENLITEYYNDWDGKDISNFSQDERNDFAWKIQNYESSLSVYATLYKNLKPLFEKNLSEEDKAIKEELREVTEEANDLQLSLEEIRQKFAEGVVAKSVNVLDYLKPEKIIKGFSSWFGSTSTVQSKAAQVLYKMANRAFALTAQETSTQGEILKGIKERYDRWAKSKGLNARNYFDIIKKKAGYNKEGIEEKRKNALDDLKLRKELFSDQEYKSEIERINEKFDTELKGKNELIDEYNPKFYSALRKKTTDRDFEWIKENIDVEAYKEYITNKRKEEIKRVTNKTRHGKPFSIKNQLTEDLIKVELKYDITSKEGLGWLLYDDLRKFPKEEWKSAEWKELYKKDSAGNYINAPAVEFYEYIKERNEYFESIKYISPKQERIFLPYVRKGIVEKITMGGKVTLFESTLRAITVSEGDVGYGEIHPITKEPVYTIPKYFTRDTGEEVSNDLFKNMTLINEMALRYQYLNEIEGQFHLILKTEANKEAIKTSYFGKTKLDADGEPELTNDNAENTQLVRDMMESIIYGHKFVENQNFDQLLIKLGGFGKKVNDKLGINFFPEEFDNNTISLNKSINWINNAFQLKALGLNPLSSLATLFGGTFQSTINAGRYFTKSEFIKNEFLMASRMNGVDAKKYVGALQYFLPLTENNNKLIAKDLSLSNFSEEALQEFLMKMMRSADQFVQTVNFFSFLDNTIIEDGKLLNVREYLRTTPEYSQIYSVSGEERKRLNEKFEEDVKKLVAEKGVINLSTIEGNQLVIPGIDRKSDTVIDLRRKVQGITKDALGNLSEDDVRRINLNIYGKSFMVFKNWIPRLVDIRLGNLKYNSATDAYEWGRTRMLVRWVMEEGLLNSLNAFKSSVLGNDEVWVQQMRNLYEKKKSDYEKDTGKKLMMTETEFVELTTQNIKNQVMDVLFYIALTGLVLAAKGLKDDDDDRITQNRYNYMIKVLDKLRDEVAYFFNPINLVDLTKRGLFPSISLIDNYIKIIKNFSTEMYAIGIEDEKLIDKNYVIKYLLKGFPVTSQFDAIFLLFFPDLAKDLGMKSSAESNLLNR